MTSRSWDKRVPTSPRGAVLTPAHGTDVVLARIKLMVKLEGSSARPTGQAVDARWRAELWTKVLLDTAGTKAQTGLVTDVYRKESMRPLWLRERLFSSGVWARLTGGKSSFPDHSEHTTDTSNQLHGRHNAFRKSWRVEIQCTSLKWRRRLVSTFFPLCVVWN